MHKLLALFVLLAACSSPSTSSEPPASEVRTGGDESIPQEASGAGCAPAGCSGQICAEVGADIMTTCEFRPEYACYRAATCERQPSGECGWTDSPEFRACLASPPAE